MSSSTTQQQARVLVRAAGLASFRRALVERVLAGDPLAARRRIVITPTRAAAELLRQTVEQQAVEAHRAAIVLPDFATREEWIARLHGTLEVNAPLLTRVEREVLLERAALETMGLRRLDALPFDLRPGLVSAVLDFYDELKRRRRTVRRFARTLFDELRVERGTDRGSETLMQLTRVLGFVFLAYERGVAASGGLDEHVLRTRLITAQPATPFDQMIVAVADHPSDRRGLWPVDFDLIGRLPGVTRVDIVVTDEVHDAGFRDRLEQEFPGIEEHRAADVPWTPGVIVPASSDNDAVVFVSRDREEELRDAARVVRAAAEASGGVLDGATAIVFHRPLPYLYLSQQVLSDARVPYEAFDALPLAAEPYAALLDLVLAVARTGGTREAAIALVRSKLLRFEVDGTIVSGADAAALDAVLGERQTSGAASTYVAEIAGFFRDRPTRAGSAAQRAQRAAVAAAEASAALGGFTQAPCGSMQVRALSAFLKTHEDLPTGDEAWVERHRRARSAVLEVLADLADAFARHDDHRRHPDALTGTIHHAIEGRTFTPRRGDAGVHLTDAVAARFGEFDHVLLVGLVEADWPDRPARSIFFAPSLLKALGWPQHSDEQRAQQAGFCNLLRLARRTTRLSAFQLEGDSIMALSPVLEEVHDLPRLPAPAAPPTPLFIDEYVAGDRLPANLDVRPAAWLAMRVARPALTDRAYSGFVQPQAPRAYRVSRVDRYIDCPFKYFAESVLALPEEREEVAGPSPLERGTLLHALFERFYSGWQAAGYGAITPATIEEALAMFTRLVEDAMATLAPSDRPLERTRLLGSLVGRGVAERVFELEADSGVDVTRRMLEQELTGTFTFPVLHGLGTRAIEIRGKADRVDVLGDGSLRVVDYKLGKLPDVESSIQIAVYAHCARAMLEAGDGGVHPVSSAMYLAFGDDRRLDGKVGGTGEAAGMAVAARVGEFARAIDRIEAGEFPPRPMRPTDCQWCAYKGVCRRVLVEDDAAEPV